MTISTFVYVVTVPHKMVRLERMCDYRGFSVAQKSNCIQKLQILTATKHAISFYTFLLFIKEEYIIGFLI